MKKFFAIAIAVLLIAVSAFPAFASNVVSPVPTKANYIVETEEEEGGHIDVDYKTGVDENGNQTVVITAVPKDGYEFKEWIINGQYTTNGSLTSAVLEMIISSDMKVKAVYAKKGEAPTEKPADNKVVDNGTKSPQTGSDDFAPYVVLFVSAAALAAVVIAAKRRSANK